MTTNTKDLQAVMSAADYVELFGAIPAGKPADDYLQRRYRKLALHVHPDANAGDASAAQAFARLAQLYQDAQEALKQGRYGKREVAVIKSKRYEHSITKAHRVGDLCATYLAFTKPKSGGELSTFVKIARNSGDNDLLQAEAAAIKKLRADSTDAALHPFVPELVDSFAYAEKGKPGRQANVIARLEGFVTLADIRQAFPFGIDPLDMVWMWRRLLYVLGYAHANGVIHGAVLPQNVLVKPGQHGVVLADWCYASQAADDGSYPPIKAIVAANKDWYPVEVLNKEAPSPATDIALATRCMMYVSGGNPKTGSLGFGRMPAPFRAFMRACIKERQAARPDDAWALLGHLDELLKRLGEPFYPRKFHPFAMPTGTATT